MVQLNTAAVMRQSMEASKAGHMLMSLALLPSAKIQTGLDVIKVYIGAHNLEEEFRVILEKRDSPATLERRKGAFQIARLQGPRTNGRASFSFIMELFFPEMKVCEKLPSPMPTNYRWAAIQLTPNQYMGSAKVYKQKRSVCARGMERENSIFADIGCQGRISDGGVLSGSSLV
ncbi:uncharacterized protein LOC111048411 isoform X2 [Nilaparvata lugens]|nr:uncharacterized protein LOC111048411 isoform X2 [Nilaparvata lugens]XP_039276460.1 uncharacterized protein LOC111048411 isoform X2 [Nilaparvata lugens]XP_039276461.1 uncharacterized protein LOC111048411 isoform X2 [Nilaparvata lugens]